MATIRLEYQRTMEGLRLRGRDQKRCGRDERKHESSKHKRSSCLRPSSASFLPAYLVPRLNRGPDARICAEHPHPYPARSVLKQDGLYSQAPKRRGERDPPDLLHPEILAAIGISLDDEVPLRVLVWPDAGSRNRWLSHWSYGVHSLGTSLYYFLYIIPDSDSRNPA